MEYYDGTKFDIVGKKYGRWTVLDRYMLNLKHERVWLCRCDCGNESFVVERSLKSGNSKSCGCLRKEKVRAANSKDLTGKVFGDLTVLSRSEKVRKNGGVIWNCRCSCGESCEVLATLLITGKQTNCKGAAHEKKYITADIAGKKFGKLTVLYATEKRDRKGSVIWHCHCDCGNDIDMSYNVLMYSTVQSCGCKRKEHGSKLHTSLTHIGGTCLDMIKSEKIPSNNTTGSKGVYLIRGKYVAKITLQKKTYSLGTFSNIEEAIESRKTAEKELFGILSEYYNKYKAKVESSPEWGESNPIKINVFQDEFKHFKIDFNPQL